MPESGTIKPTLISAGCCARAALDSPIAAAPESTVRLVTDVLELPFETLFLFIFVLLVCFLINGLVTCRGRPCAHDRPPARSDCRLRARLDQPRERSRDRQTPAPPPRAAPPAGSSSSIGGGFRSGVRR